MRTLLYLIVVVAVGESMSFESARADNDGQKPTNKAAVTADKPKSAPRKTPASPSAVAVGKTSGVAHNERETIPKAQEAAAVAFVKQHHPELFELIKYLQMGMPREYEQAIRDLSHTSERLAQIEKRDVDRYQLELRLWQAESRRQLLTARLQMDPDETLISELRDTLQQEIELAVTIARHERDRLANRLERLNEQIENQVQNRDTLVERKLSTLTKAAKASERKTQDKIRKNPTTKTKKQPI